MVNKVRRFLINLGKVLPFILCFIVLVGFSESFIALYNNDYLLYDNCFVLNTPISFWIGKKFQYDILSLFIIAIISIAIESCKWNKLAVVYLLIVLMERNIFIGIELYKEYIFAIVIVNLIVCGFFVYKGLIIFLKNFKKFGG